MYLYLHRQKEKEEDTIEKYDYSMRMKRFVLSTQPSLYLYDCVKTYDTTNWGLIEDRPQNMIVIYYRDNNFNAMAFYDRHWLMPIHKDESKFLIFYWDYGEDIEDQYYKCAFCNVDLKEPKKEYYSEDWGGLHCADCFSKIQLNTNHPSADP